MRYEIYGKTTEGQEIPLFTDGRSYGSKYYAKNVMEQMQRGFEIGGNRGPELFVKEVLDDSDAVAKDAARWRALMSCDRIRIFGSAKLGDPENPQHIGMEIWEKFRFSDKAPNDETVQMNKKELTLFADTIIARNP